MSLQMSFLEAVVPVGKPTRPAPVAQRSTGAVDGKTTYDAWKTDVAWMMDHQEDLQAGILLRQLRLLADPQVGEDERADLLEWLRAVATSPPEPFSFSACVRAYDPRIDPIELRDSVLAQLGRLGLARPIRRAA